MAEIIDFKTTKKIHGNEPVCSEHNTKQECAEDDILQDEKVFKFMQKFVLGIDSNNILESWKPTGPKPAGKSYAESVLSKSVLKMYGYNLPWQLVQAPCSNRRAKITHNLYDIIYHDHTARKIMIVLACSYFFKMPVSRGFFSMLYNTPATKRSKDFQISQSIKSLSDVNLLILTDNVMEQPVQPSGICFTSKDNQIILPTPAYLHRFIEVVAWSMRFAVKNYSEMELAMQPYTDKFWRSAQPTAEGMHVFSFVEGVK